ncbi:MAG: glycosyltransferase family 39 protein, partial [Anaerolineae bacterium]|nr:glycosyltransferase family 39 protein [Anaerolineae bacterium]
MKPKPHPLVIILLSFAILVLLHGWATPVFEAPDEVWHYAYARWLAEGQGLPSMANDDSGANQEVAQPPLYYAAAALLSTPFQDNDLDTLFWHNPNFGFQAPGTIPDNKNMLIHPQTERWPGTGAALTVRATRLASLLFGLVTVTATWGLAYETFGKRSSAHLAASLVAFHPQFAFICSVVNNDSAASALATAALWSAARIVRRGLTTRRALASGVLVGLAILTKTSALLLLPVIGVALLIAGWRETPSIKRWTLAWMAYATVALAVGGWWYGRNLVLYGDPLGLTSHLNTLWGRPQPISLAELLPEIPLLIRSFWGAYGWGHIWWPDYVYLILSPVSLILIAWGMMRVIQPLARPQPNSRPNETTGVMIYALCAIWFFAILVALLQWMRQVEAPHGRLLFPAIGAWSTLLTAGLVLPHSRRRRLQPASKVIVLAFASLTLLAPGARILATFALPRLVSLNTVAASTVPLPLTYDDEVQLLSAEIRQRRLAPGETFEVHACWTTRRPINSDYTVFLQLLGPENLIVAERRTYPGLGRFPTSLWPVGRAFCDNYRMEVGTWAPQPMVYRLEIGLFTAEHNRRLQARDEQGQAIDPPIVTQVAVVAPEPIQPAPAFTS